MAEEAGYRRYWVAEHHGHEGIAGAATSVVLAHIGHHTSRIRIGAGGIMLPNHNPFVIAEQFGTLEALFPGRIDLGLGRAPGAGPQLSQALQKDIYTTSQRFPQDVVALSHYLGESGEVPLRATPGAGSDAVEMWMLGSSLFGAELAARLGLPYSFAAHFAPRLLDEAVETYRSLVTPGAIEQPRLMVAMNVITADTDAEAEYLASSLEQAFVALRSGAPGKLKPPVENYRAGLPADQRAMLDGVGAARAVGSPDTVRAAIAAMVERTGADEIITSGAIHDPQARHRSLRLTAEALAG